MPCVGVDPNGREAEKVLRNKGEMVAFLAHAALLRFSSPPYLRNQKSFIDEDSGAKKGGKWKSSWKRGLPFSRGILFALQLEK